MEQVKYTVRPVEEPAENRGIHRSVVVVSRLLRAPFVMEPGANAATFVAAEAKLELAAANSQPLP